MARRRSFDEITYEIEHARPVHPLRALFQNHFYLDGWYSSELGLSLMMINALLFVPFMMFLFFYPYMALVGLGIGLVIVLTVYESVLLWRRYRRRNSPSA